jgi:hypothetical protein
MAAAYLLSRLMIVPRNRLVLAGGGRSMRRVKTSVLNFDLLYLYNRPVIMSLRSRARGKSRPLRTGSAQAVKLQPVPHTPHSSRAM